MNRNLGANLRRNWTLYTMVLPGVVLLLIFSYIPMYGIVMAFQRFKPALGFFRSPIADPWYRYFQQLFTDPYFFRLLKNTLLLGVYSLLWSFPAPIALALLFNELQGRAFKRTVQTISYMPYFLSTVVVVGIMKILFATGGGPIESMLASLGIKLPNLFMMPSAFRSLYIGSGLWSGIGYSSIIYLAAIAGINPELYEAARIDGARRFQQMRYITLPSMLPTITILLIFAVSGIIGNDYQKILLIYSEATFATSDVLGTYVYRIGIAGNSQSYAAAAGLFTSAFAFALLAMTNWFAKRFGETSLW